MLPAERDGQPYPEPVLAGHVPTQEKGTSVLVEGPELSTTSNDKLLDGRVGKVAISPGHEGLQVDGSNFSSGSTSPGDQVGAAPAIGSKTEKGFISPSSPPKKSRPRKKLIFLIIALILVVIAAVLGGVLGSRAASGRTSPSPSTSNTPNTTSPDPDTPCLIKQRSGLSVTAWRKTQGGLQILLYYQSLDGALQRSTYDDPRNASAYENSYWGTSRALGDADKDEVANDTGLAATMILWSHEYEPQINLFYVQSSAVGGLRAKWTVNSVEAKYNQYKGVDDYFEDARTGSNLAGYWPYYARLDADNVVAMWRDDPYFDVEPYATGNWSTRPGRVSAADVMAGSKLSVVPTGPNMTSLALWRNYGLFYQSTTGELALLQPEKGYSKANNTFVDSWRSDTVFPLIPLAPGGSFAAFATARPDSSEGLVNTYVLYQEPSSRISMVYLDNKSQWLITQPEALSIADNGTSIACITMPMTEMDAHGNNLALEMASAHANRCYFQRAGQVIEVALNGTDWTELGTVPIE